MCCRHPMTRHLLYLQLRHDILDERLTCSDEHQIFELAALALHAEYGEWSDRASEALIEHYVAPNSLRSTPRQHAYNALQRRYRQLDVMSDFEAEAKFIQVIYAC